MNHKQQIDSHLAKSQSLSIAKYFLLFCFAAISLSVLGLLWLNQDIEAPASRKSEIAKTSHDKQQQYNMTLNNPIFKGTNKYYLPYKVTAKSALKKDDNEYQLFDVKAHYPMNNSDVKINSSYGSIQNDNKLLSLEDRVKIYVGDIEFVSQKLEIKLDSQDAISNTKVTVIKQNSLVTSNEFKTENSGDIIYFKDNVHTKISTNDFLNKQPTESKGKDL